MAEKEKIRFLLPGVESTPDKSRVHPPASRGVAPQVHELLEDITVRRHFDLSAPQRAAGQKTETPPLEDDDVLALEMEGGFVLYTSAARLAEDLQRIDPTAAVDGVVNLEALRRQVPQTRGLGDWVIRGLSILGIDDKWLIAKAADKAQQWGGDVLVQGASWAATKAIMWAVEQKLERKPGLYRWTEDDRSTDELLEPEIARADGFDAAAHVLVFIHGTGSSTKGSFGELRRPDAARELLALRSKFGKHIYGFEHLTFSESPVENALELARALPAGVHLSLVTHSRGGLVGDLICAAGFPDDLVATSFMRPDPKFAQANEEDRKNLAALAAELNRKKFQIERYVRVGCPAQGTLLASSHLDAFLSVLLYLIGMVPALAATPYYAVVKRIALQIAKNRTDPHLVPGIEAMLPDSPLAALIGRVDPQNDQSVGVVAGDIEGGGVLKRLGAFLTDYLMFEDRNNDLVVDTESMFGGIAREHGSYVFDQGEDVSHFRYFANARTRRALQAWLTWDAKVPQEFEAVRPRIEPTAMQRGVQEITGARPVVFFLPGIMGSHLAVEQKKIWFSLFELGLGKLAEIALDRPNITSDGIFEMFYGELCARLALTHELVVFDYDWRQPLEDIAALLAQRVDEALERTAASNQPVCLMTHSMGGLVTRAMIANHRDTWARLAARAGARWVMLGTPNRGSHGAVESLLGLSGNMRKLAILSGSMGLQGVIDLVATFPGAVQLLPRPDFRDTGNARYDYYSEAFWREFKQGNNSPWFGTDIGAVPTTAVLNAARSTWDSLTEDLPNPECIVYVAGYGFETPCGIERDDGGSRRLRVVGTLAGDGTVTHDSGILDVLERNHRVWFMNADHAALAGTEEHFPALLELLDRGETSRLPQARPAMRGVEQLFRYEPGPVLYPTEQEMQRALIGGRRPPRRHARATYTLSVACRSMDLRHAIYPILVGHYEGDAISGAEAQIDRFVVDNRLTLRHHLDAYAGPAGTAVIVIDEPREAEKLLRIRRGAIVVGFGQFGELKLAGLAGAIRQGVLGYLLQLYDRSVGREKIEGVGLTSLLLGYNSTTHITIQDSVATVVRAVMEANRQFADTSGVDLRVERLEFVELYEDVAISAAKALRELPERLREDANRLGFRIEAAAPVLECGEGMRSRLEATASSFDYWPRMIVTGVTDERTPTPSASPPQLAVPRGLRYVFVSMRARAEDVKQQFQPGVIQELLRTSIMNPRHQPDFARALFHLLVPHDFKEAARQADNLVLVVDGYTANLPWEMLVADDEPLVRNTAMVRQLESSRFRHHVRSTREKRAYVIGNPSTAGYYKAFPRSIVAMDGESATTLLKSATGTADSTYALPDLPGAAAEARAVADLLTGEGYQVVEAGTGAEAIQVFDGLYEKAYRILHVSAHGVFQAGTGEDRRTGVVLSNGLLLTAAEIGALEVVPDLVFLNCCHAGRMDEGPETAFNRLAYSVSRELIECGVRAVIAAGWAVDDDAARHFAERFYESFVRARRPFGKAVYEARLSTYEEFPESNTWGAFQAYGEPSFVMDPESLPLAGQADFRPVAPQELVARIDLLRNELARSRERGDAPDPQLGRTVERLLRPGIAESWSQEPEVLYALARLHADEKDFERARKYYQDAIAMEDKRGRVPVIAIEQLANLESRHGFALAKSDRSAGEKLIRDAIDRLKALVTAADGVGEPPGTPVNAERCALFGGAYKRLGCVLLSEAANDAESRSQAKDALNQAADWYGRGERDPDRPTFSASNMHNRLALLAVLGSAEPKDAELAVRLGELAYNRYPTTRRYFDAVMLADGYLIAALIDGSLARDDGTLQAIIERYEEVRHKIPETERWRDSVTSQIELLAELFEKLHSVDDADKIAARLREIAYAVRGSGAAPEASEPRARRVTGRVSRTAEAHPGSDTGENARRKQQDDRAGDARAKQTTSSAKSSARKTKSRKRKSAKRP